MLNSQSQQCSKRLPNKNQSNRKGGPILLSNMEVLEILRKRVEERNLNSITGTRQIHQQMMQRRNPRHRHRDWIEEHVVQYIQYDTPCLKLKSLSNLFELDATLTSPKCYAKTRPTLQASITTQENIEKKLAPLLPNTSPPCDIESDRMGDTMHIYPIDDAERLDSENSTSLTTTTSYLTGFGLTEAESLQVLNLVPSEIVEIHLLIEDLQSRMTESEQEMLLKTVSKFTTDESVKQFDQHPGNETYAEDHNEINEMIEDVYVKVEEEDAFIMDSNNNKSMNSDLKPAAIMKTASSTNYVDSTKSKHSYDSIPNNSLSSKDNIQTSRDILKKKEFHVDASSIGTKDGRTTQKRHFEQMTNEKINNERNGSSTTTRTNGLEPLRKVKFEF